jgi:hypothetical protein
MTMTTTTRTASGRATALLLAAIAAGCISHQVQSAPIEIKPIHITMDINLRVQRELDEFFDFEDRSAATPPTETTSPETNGKE